MAKMTVSRLKQMVEELLTIASIYKRYKSLEKEVKQGLVDLKYGELDVPGKGRVKISTYDRVTVTPEVAVDILGEELASKVIVIKKVVSNDIVKAFVKAGEISEAQRDELMEQAEKKPVISLYVRPLE